MANPDNKKRSDGKLFGGRKVQSGAKAVKAKGKLPKANMEVGKGSDKLMLRRLWRMLGGDDQ